MSLSLPELELWRELVYLQAMPEQAYPRRRASNPPVMMGKEALFRKDYTQFQFLAQVEVGFSDKAWDWKSCQFLNCKSSLF